MLNCQGADGQKIQLQGRILPQISIFKQLYTYGLPILIFGNTNPENVCNLFCVADTQAANMPGRLERLSRSRAVRLYYLQTIQAELFAVFRQLSQ